MSNQTGETPNAASESAATKAGTCPYSARMQEINSAAEMEELMRSPAFEKKGGGTYFRADQVGFIMGGTLIDLRGAAHRARRRLYSPLFSSPKVLADLQAWLLPTIKQRVSELPVGNDGLVRTDIVKFVRNISLEIAARIIGLDDMQTTARIESLGDVADRLMASVKAHLDFQPGELTGDARAAAKERFIAEKVRDARSAKEEFVQAFYAPARTKHEALIAQHRSKGGADADLPKDILSLLILNEEELRNDPGWDNGDLPVRECMMILGAADHTTSMAASHTIRDLFEWVASHPDDKARLTDLRFLRQASQESLRLHQATDPNPNLRGANKDVVLSTGRHIANGEVVAMRFGVGSRDPEQFGADADRFNPHRELTGAVRRPPGFAFSGGAHGCLAQALVVGTGDGEEICGDLPLMLHALFLAGIQPDPVHVAVPKIHAHVDPESGARREIEVWDSYPVVFADHKSDV